MTVWTTTSKWNRQPKLLNKRPKRKPKKRLKRRQMLRKRLRSRPAKEIK
jgi:hypothetical protein